LLQLEQEPDEQPMQAPPCFFDLTILMMTNAEYAAIKRKMTIFASISLPSNSWKGPEIRPPPYETMYHA
jgi:hypothetical protein